MKVWLPTVLLVFALATSGLAQTAPPPPIIPVPAPPATMQKDGPYRLLMAAKVDARERRAHGFRADVVFENGMWWVVFYP